MATERGTRFSQLIAGIMTFVVTMLAILYLCAVYWSYRLLLRTPRPINKESGVRLQRYAPGVYAFLVFLSLSTACSPMFCPYASLFMLFLQLGLSSWLLAQYNFNQNAPAREALAGLKLTIFTSSWTFTTGSIFTVMFIHPVWATLPWSSIGVQGVWIIVTWSFWIASSSIMSSALPALYSRGICFGLVYCRQLQAVYALSVLETLSFAAGMLTIIWLVWRTTRDLLLPHVDVNSTQASSA